MRRQLAPGRLVLATHNPGKVVELAELLGPHGLDIVSAGDLGLAEPEETGETFIANAELKALAAATASGLPALADDSGLCVDALGGAPGIYSARWAGPGKDFAIAMARVHDAMGQDGPRTAHFICALTIAWPDGHTESVEGRCDGRLVWPPRGDKGFGYDPMFVMDGKSRSFGEISRAEKEADNHRARAFAQLLPLLPPR
ncbi:RdgB/HAM1 family non-canonical purine NTP pyrophosphatase [Polymorphobacter fuscus]|uniref:dITP/XTP pyrophosphatase n=1 Tax=Sandarakinorhabdus fusca TaxID=1439888 RepID=A0A7C9KZE4_9SPHN|nr:RdgB/HAM1 family non-canonical purine NTP pyrophosphatase [Polymorphobacter fuscus]KAB7645479.1 RdgB/HAM1 family non-canonical purine NTP pyrophosphatase [Polymorphobacter fuscus]MQT17908.1 RdgB/HAM1 family non-canonical purine NTP pyrophosphatase [Polymorphobacter fuscus]NJC08538.1 XTP/dITP diphosphohydrolase [Polymorphobacter fuscus]